jgi:hypothetical protein
MFVMLLCIYHVCRIPDMMSPTHFLPCFKTIFETCSHTFSGSHSIIMELNRFVKPSNRHNKTRDSNCHYRQQLYSGTEISVAGAKTWIALACCLWLYLTLSLLMSCVCVYVCVYIYMRTTSLDTTCQSAIFYQLSISQKALGTLPEDGNIMPKHVGATIHN